MGKTLKMLSIGTATQDVFLIGGDIFKPSREEDGKDYEQLLLGAKLRLKDVVFATGGNAMNAAVAFARQGLDSEFMGVIGTEPAGQAVLAELDADGVGTRYLHQDERFRTNYSTILLAPTGERTILSYHGNHLRPDGSDIHLDAIAEADWLYVSSVGSMELLDRIFGLAAKNGVQVAFNPSGAELAQADKLRPLLDDVTVLITNKDEMQQIVEGQSAEELLHHAAHLVRTVVISDGPNGVVATDGKHVIEAGMYEDVPVIDRTGAGDAFGSGFVAMYAQGKALEEAVTFASANATSVVQQIGAKAGILHRHAKLHDMPIKVSELVR
ncbi:MAG: carbohydrate kinase family protein [Candidatus Saccharimonadales bacterium]